MSFFQRFKQGIAIAAAGAAVSVALAGAAAAQQCPDWQLGGIPITTDADTAWTPQQFPLFAGGTLDLSACASVPGGTGRVTPAPNFTIQYDARDLGRDLEFRVQTDCDTTLLINDSTGTWHFNDDEDGTLQPRLRLPNAPSGQYDVWVGTFGAQSCQATLVAETFPGGSTQASCPDWSLGGAEVRLTTGGAPVTQTVVAGGSVNLFENANQCGVLINGTPAHGYLASAPDFTLYLDPAGQVTTLNISVQGQCDTTLLVNDPSETWLFNDDSNDLQPAIEIGDAADGRYDVWVGTFGSDTCQSTITFSATTPAAPQPQPPAGK